MRAASVRPHVQGFLDPEYQDVALDLQPIVSRALVAVQSRDLPVRGHDNALGIRVRGQNPPATGVRLERWLQVDGLNVDQVVRQGQEEVQVRVFWFSCCGVAIRLGPLRAGATISPMRAPTTLRGLVWGLLYGASDVKRVRRRSLST